MKKFTVDDMVLRLDSLVVEYKNLLQNPPKGLRVDEISFLEEEIDLFESIILELNMKKGFH
jgi:hypothetical protein